MRQRVLNIILLILYNIHHDKDDINGLMCQYINNIGIRQYFVYDDTNKNNEAKFKNIKTVLHSAHLGGMEVRLYRLISLK